MLDGIAGSFASSARSNASIDWCAGDSVMKISVLPHQTMHEPIELVVGS